MKLKKLVEEAKVFERSLAYGSETPLWGDFCDSMHKLTGVYGHDADDRPDVEVEDVEAEWWLTAYRVYEHDVASDEPEFDSIQALYDSVTV